MQIVLDVRALKDQEYISYREVACMLRIYVGKRVPKHERCRNIYHIERLHVENICRRESSKA